MAEQAGDIKKDSKKKILILSANPKNTDRLRLEEEVRDIEERLQLSKHRELFDFQPKFALRLRDLQQALLDFEPNIVHFIGHGTEEGLIAEDEMGFAALFSSEALSGLFELCSSHVECVILNACYSAPQAEAISKHIDYVIGMKKEIENRIAVEFAVGFYGALGAGKSIEEAFKFGCVATSFFGVSDHLIPVLKKKPSIEKQDPEMPIEHDKTYKTNLKTKRPNEKKKSTDIISSLKKKFKSHPIIFLATPIILAILALLLLYPLIHKPDSQSGTSEKTGSAVKSENKLPPSNQKNPATQGEQNVNEKDKSREILSIESKQSDSPKPGKPKTSPAQPLPNGNLLKEIREKGLLEKLREAGRFYDAGNYDGKNKALTLYREVIKQLSQRTKQCTTSLNKAVRDDENNNLDSARDKYKAFFDRVIKDSEQERDIVYLNAADYKGDPEIEFNNNGDLASLTSKDWNNTGYWIKFKNNCINWNQYDQVRLKVDYHETTEFDQSAMLKLQLNETILSPIEGKVKQLGTTTGDRYLMQDRGSFYYPFKSSDLVEDNEILITLNKGKWQNFYIELALTKNEAK